MEQTNEVVSQEQSPQYPEVPDASNQAQNNTVEIGSSQQNQQAAAAIAELDKLEKFKFQGKEWTPKDLEKAMLRQEDYTRKTQDLKKESKYYEALAYDLEKVRKNPALVAEFRSTYPKKFHQHLEQLLATGENTGSQAQQQNTAGHQAVQAQAQIPREYLDRFERVEQMVHEKEVSAITAQLESWDTELSKKYPMAEPNGVYATLDSLKTEQGEEFKPSKEIWESAYKQSQEYHQKRYESHYQDLQKQQREAGRLGRDSGPGGGTATQPAPKYRTIREATKAMVSQLQDG